MADIQKSDIQAYIIEYIRDHVSQADLVVKDSTDFVESGLLDSFAILSLIMGLESHFSIKFQAAELADPMLRTVGFLTRTVFNKTPRG